MLDMAISNTRLICFLLILFYIADTAGSPQMKPYEFAYNVSDSLSGNDFGHRESSDGEVVHGQYYVLLPDGQMQTVTYTADALNGYQAQVDTSYHAKIRGNVTERRTTKAKDNCVDLNNNCERLVSGRPERCKLDDIKEICQKSCCKLCRTSNRKKVRCGVEKQAPGPTRIVNGDDVNVIRKYSWQVSIQRRQNDGSFKHSCGGSIITNYHILTAAHCVVYNITNKCYKMLAKNVFVSIGDHNIKQTDDNHVDFVAPIVAKQVLPHTTYNCFDFIKGYDIAIIELSKSIDLKAHTDDIHPICLPKIDNYVGKRATITGWGSLVGYRPNLEPNKDFLPVYPDVLQEGLTTVISNSDCNKLLAKINNDIIGKKQICAVNKRGFQFESGQGICQGDSGGPLSVKQNRRHVQIGIASGTPGCASKGSPSIFTRVTKFLVPWIRSIVGSEETYTVP